MAIDIQMPALSQIIPTPRSPMRMQGSIEGPMICAERASMDTCIRRYERVYMKNMGKK